MKLNKRKMERQFQREGILPSTGVKRSKTGQTLRDIGSLIYPEYKGQKSLHGFTKSTYRFIDNPNGKGEVAKKRKNPFGKIKDKGLFEGGFF